MKTLTTGAGSYLTGDEIAAAVLDYWRELSRDHGADVVIVPFLDDEHVSRVHLAIGWGMSLAVVESRSPASLVDSEVVETLRSRQRLARAGGDSPFLPEEVAELNTLSAIL
jgi:hypothetical protein